MCVCGRVGGCGCVGVWVCGCEGNQDLGIVLAATIDTFTVNGIQ